MDSLTLTQPDDWHLHLRDGAALAAVLPDTCRQMGRAIVMPNLKPPVTTVDAAASYRERILAARPHGSQFEPLMTLYLTDGTTADEIRRARASGFVHAVKLYPAGATTNSDSGVTSIERAMPALEAMAACGMPLLVHGEVTDPAVDVFDREAVFLETVFAPLHRALPELRVVFEHITTAEAAEFVAAAEGDVAATITVHHLLLNRNALFNGGLRPHHYCLPVLKRERHRQALLAAATSGSTRFFLGTDSAPHARHAKESDCGCAGMYSAHAALELYAEAFDSVGRLDRLEAFASFNGPDFYRLPRNTRQLTLRRQPSEVAPQRPYADGTLVPLRAGGRLEWALQAEGE
ncbi:dihydroorotase [Paludibacterium yongneupense]|uniref:dihydroorotase n=1 Tax=Paludibacterium yongneupense TaxID=400061 RepID=UPI000427D140|nr:dihydroorotase [Paludibacterium yongneupense]